jgi:hypothetical protein
VQVFEAFGFGPYPRPDRSQLLGNQRLGPERKKQSS